MVVDDDKAVREIVCALLVSEGYYVGAAEDGLDALKELQTNKYHLIISDLNMPRMGGLELLENLSLRKRRPISIIMTGSPLDIVSERVKELGVSELVQKPFIVTKFLNTVEKCLKNCKTGH